MGIEAIGGISAAPVMGNSFSTIVNEGPVSLHALENTMPLTLNRFNPLGEIVFKPSGPSVIEQAAVPTGTRQAEAVAAQAWESSELNAADAIAEANQILGIHDTSLRAIRQPAESVAILRNVVPQVEPMILPLPDYQPPPSVIVSPKAESRVAVSPQPLSQEQEVGEVVKKKVAVEEPEDSLEEEIIKEERMYLEDEEASAQRRYEVKEAVGKAKTEADRLGLKKIAGWLVAKFLPAEHPGNRSQVVKEHGPDGSYEETVETISLAGEFDSERQAKERLNGIVTEKKPIKLGKNGTPVKNEDVVRVLKYQQIVKPAVAHEIVIKRVVKKQVQVSAGQAAVEPKSETSLEDYPELAEVFQKAA